MEKKTKAKNKNKKQWGTSLAVQWLRLQASTAGGMDSIPGWGPKILHDAWHGQKKPQETNNNELSPN